MRAGAEMDGILVEADELGKAQACLGREQEQGVVAASEPCRAIWGGENRFDLGPRQEMHLAFVMTLAWYRQDSLDQGAVSRLLERYEPGLLAWRLSVTMEASFCVEALEDALAHAGKPELVNTDQGAQFTGLAFTGLPTKQSIAISMDGKGAWRDNVFVERLWRTIKYEEGIFASL